MCSFNIKILFLKNLADAVERAKFEMLLINVSPLYSFLSVHFRHFFQFVIVKFGIFSQIKFEIFIDESILTEIGRSKTIGQMDQPI